MAWTPPEFDGGLPLARYTVEINDTSQWSYWVFVGVTSKDGLKPGTLYTVYVQAFSKFVKGEKGQSTVISGGGGERGENVDAWRTVSYLHFA